MKYITLLVICISIGVMPYQINAQCEINQTMFLGGPYDLGGDPEIQTSCDGSVIVWAGNDGLTDRIFYSVNGGTPVILSSTTPNNSEPTVSCDGETVTWFSDNGTTSQVYFSRIGGTPTPLTTTSPSNSSPEIDCDGSTIVWYSVDGSQREIYYSENGAQPVLIPGTNQPRRPTISCMGNVVIWGEGNLSNQLFRSVNGGTGIQISLVNTSDNTDEVVNCDGEKVFWIGRDNATNMENIYKWESGIASIVQAIGLNTRVNDLDINCDGTVLTWTQRVNANQQVFVKTNNNAPIQLSNFMATEENATDPKIDCNGSTIVWGVQNRPVIYHYDVATTTINSFNVGADDVSLEISCDGSTIVWEESNLGNSQYFTRKLSCPTVVPPAPIPTLSQWSLIIYGLLILNVSLAFLLSINKKQPKH